MKKKTFEEFINDFNKKFPNKNFDFSESKYIDTHTEMIVKCDNGHYFSTRPNDLLNGSGCSICYGNKKLSKEDFIRESNYVHNGFFTYHHCGFTNVSSKVIVTCPIHGDIEVKASNHLNGANCKYCSRKKIKHKIAKREKKSKNTKKVSFGELKGKVYNKWGNKYTLDENSNYTTYNRKMYVNCKEHGVFKITPSHLLTGRGCPKCAGNKKKTIKQIVNEIRNAHPYSEYDFSKVEYVNTHTPIMLKCNHCGTVFQNSPSNLIFQKNGCPGCASSQLELEVKNFLEKNSIKYTQQKIFDWLKNKRNLKLDFYLNDYKAAIECQGIQHFEEVKFSNTCDPSLHETRHRDNLKKTLCEENGINVFYYANYHYDFPYKVYEDMNELLISIKNNKND